MEFNLKPIDYSIPGAVSPLEAYSQGLSLAANQQEQQMKIQQAAVAQQQMQIAQQRQKMVFDEINKLNQMQNPGVNDYARVANLMPKEEAQKFMDVWANLDKEKKKETLNFSGQVMSSLNAGRNDIAIKKLQEAAEAAKNSGDMQLAKEHEDTAELIKSNPGLAKSIYGTTLAFLPDGKDVLSAIAAQQKTEAEAVKQPYELQKLQAETKELGARAENYKQEQITKTKLELYKLNKGAGVNLEPDARKFINDSVVNSVSLDAKADKYNGLADKLGKLEGGGKGIFTKANLLKNKLFGSQQELDAALAESTRLLNAGIIEALPPGNQSDTDIKIFSRGTPDEGSDIAYLQSYFRGAAKIQKLEAEGKKAQAKWMSLNGSLGDAQKEMNINGINVGVGNSYSDFWQNYLQKYQQKQNKATVESRSYYNKY